MNDTMLAASISEPVNGFFDVLQDSPQEFFQPRPETHLASITVAQQYLDPLAAEISQQQLSRLKENRKRKRHDRQADGRALRLKKIHIEGFGWSQIWEQARRILDASVGELKADFDTVEGLGHDNTSSREPNDDLPPTSVRFDDGEELSDAEDEVGLHGKGPHQHIVHSSAASNEHGDVTEVGGNTDAESALEGTEGSSSEENKNGRADTFVEDVHGLNDGFFSIDNFNRQTEFLEQADARGDPDDGAASDEEDVDWDADPLAGQPTDDVVTGAHGRREAEETDEDDDEDGPTFGDMDLDAPEGASEDEHDDVLIDDGEGGGTDNLMYDDFFAPPARKAHKSRKDRAKKQSQAKDEAFISLDPPQDDMQRAISTVHGDIFSDIEDDAGNGSELEDADGLRSTHERRQAALLQQIRELEAANVAKREWTLSGEARAADRPANSLLAEDLDFERAGKPVPVITKEITEDIEAMIKRRILAKEFDEVLRRRPDDVLSGPLGRRGVLDEVQDTKSKKGLAELYEEEHLRRTDPAYVDARDERLKAEHREIEGMWKDISAKLDALASWNYRPRPVEMSIQVRTDAPVVTMEDARPTGVGGSELATTSQLAPQEVYRPGQELQKGERATKGGTVLTTDELSREDKKRLRRQAKERAQKAGVNAAPTTNGAQKGNKQRGNGVAKDLKQGGVMIVDRKGNLSTVDGKSSRSSRAFLTAGSLKL